MDVLCAELAVARYSLGSSDRRFRQILDRAGPFPFYFDNAARIKHVALYSAHVRKLACNESRVQITTPSIYETRYARKTNTARSAMPDTSEKWPENAAPFAPRYFHPGV